MRDQIVLPGLINTHTHAPMVMYRGLADDLALMDWLQKYIFPAEAKTVSPELVRVGTRLAALEMIESGTTTFADMYYFEEEIAKATVEAGLRGVLGRDDHPVPGRRREDAGRGAGARRAVHPGVQEQRPDHAGGRAARALHERQGDADGVAPSSARKYGVPVIIHFAETEDEVEDRARAVPDDAGRAISNRSGSGGRRRSAAHGVWVTDDDIAILKRHGVGVSHNPESNMKLASGAAPVTKYLAAGVALGLGTDGAASNNDLDMFEAMRQASFLAKHATRDPTAVPAADGARHGDDRRRAGARRWSG